MPDNSYLAHYGVKGMKWGVRKYINEDGTLTKKGRKRYSQRGGRTQLAVDVAAYNSRAGRRPLNTVASTLGGLYGYGSGMRNVMNNGGLTGMTTAEKVGAGIGVGLRTAFFAGLAGAGSDAIQQVRLSTDVARPLGEVKYSKEYAMADEILRRNGIS